jgi:hypothetical protein
LLNGVPEQAGELTQVRDDMVGLCVGRRRNRIGVEPDSHHADRLCAGNIPLQVIPDHPGRCSCGIQSSKRLVKDRGVGLGGPEFLGDTDEVKERGEREAIELCPLAVTTAVGEKPKPDPTIP